MNTLKSYLLAIWSIIVLALGVIIGMKFARPEVTLDFGKAKVKKGGNINISPHVDVEQKSSEVKERTKIKDRKRFRIRKKNRNG